MRTEATAKLVELFTEHLVVRPQRLEHIPNGLEGRLIENLVRMIFRRDEHRQDDGPMLLLRPLADCPTKGLHDVDRRATRVDERDTVNARDVHALCQTPGVAK